MDLTGYLADVRARQDAARPPHTPREVVYPIGQATLPAHVAHWARLTPEKVAVATAEVEVTYRRLDEASRAWAGWLESVGVAPGDRVGVHLGNGVEFVIAMLGTLRAGAVHVPVNPMYRQAELVHQLIDAGVSVVVTVEPLLPVLLPAARETGVRHIVVVGGGGEGGPEVTAWSAALAAAPSAQDRGDLDAVAALNYTGGTTGVPKGCEHTQRGMLYTAASTMGATGRRAGDGLAALCFIPVFWIAGEDLGILIPLVAGGTSVLMPRWEAATALALVERHRVSTTAGTVESFLELLEDPTLSGRDLSAFTDPLAMSFIRKLTPDIRARWRAAVGEHSVLREGAYGLTETHTCDVMPYGLADGDADLLAEPVFCGLPVPGTEVAVVSPGTLTPLPLGEHGEIVVRSPAVMRGYRGRPAESAEVLHDGWLRTGDDGYIDDHGFLHYLGRRKEMLKVGGMSVFPAEVEMLLAAHPQVVGAAVVGVQHPTRGQVPVAFVRAAPGSGLDAAAVTQWARENMAGYKVPVIRVVDELPLTPTGKVRKVDLQAQAQALTAGD